MLLQLKAVFKSARLFCPIRLQKEGSDDSTPSSERLSVHAKGDEEHGGVHVKGESTESELDEEEEDDDIIQLREGDEEERGGYTQVSVRAQFFSLQRLSVLQSAVFTSKSQCFSAAPYAPHITCAVSQ